MNKKVDIIYEGRNVILISYLKGFSIFTVALMHLVTTMSSMPSSIITLSAIGGTGVHTFFLCSGIGLYLSYLKHQTSYIEFIKKRFFRIYIPYIIVIIISSFIPWMYSGDDKLIALLSHVFLFKMFFPQYEESFGTQFWFISTIFQLYFIFIPMCLLKNKLNKNVFIIIFTTMSISWWIICYFLGIGEIRIWGSFCLQYIWEFAVGFVLAEAIYNLKKIELNNYILFLCSIVGIGVQAVLAMSSDAFKIFNDIPALIGYTSLALLLSNLEIVKKIFISLSKISYELFLVHIFVFISMFRLLKPNGLFWQLMTGVLSMSIAIILAYSFNKLLYRYINRIN